MRGYSSTSRSFKVSSRCPAHVERHEQQTPTPRIIDDANPRSSVRRDPELELWGKRELVLSHESRRNAVAAGNGLHLLVVPSAAAGNLGCDDEARTVQRGEAFRVLLVARGKEQVERRLVRVVTENSADGAEQRAFAVASRAMSEKQALVGACPPSRCSQTPAARTPASTRRRRG